MLRVRNAAPEACEPSTTRRVLRAYACGTAVDRRGCHRERKDARRVSPRRVFVEVRLDGAPEHRLERRVGFPRERGALVVLGVCVDRLAAEAGHLHVDRVEPFARLSDARVDLHERPVEGNAIAGPNPDPQTRGFLRARVCGDAAVRRVSFGSTRPAVRPRNPTEERT